MSALGWWTWGAIAVLIVGSAAIFVWFLVDVWKEARGRGPDEREGRGDPGRRVSPLPPP